MPSANSNASGNVRYAASNFDASRRYSSNLDRAFHDLTRPIYVDSGAVFGDVLEVKDKRKGNLPALTYAASLSATRIAGCIRCLIFLDVSHSHMTWI